MGKSTSAGDAAGQAAQAQTRLAESLVRETTPLRRGLIKDSDLFIQGQRDVTGLPEFAAFKGSAESGFNRAKENIIANTPEGGGLTAALAGLEGQRASSQAGFTGALASDEVNRALQLATFGAAQGSQGLGSAGFLQGQRASAEGQANAGKAQGTGQAAAAAAMVAKAAIQSSDRRLKKNIEHIGMYGPYNLYAFDYLDGVHGVGVMAQEMPDRFVSKGGDGYLMVDYGLLSHGG